MAYLIRCGACTFRAAHVTRAAAADAALKHSDETQHAGIEIEDALDLANRGNGGDDTNGHDQGGGSKTPHAPR